MGDKRYIDTPDYAAWARELRAHALKLETAARAARVAAEALERDGAFVEPRVYEPVMVTAIGQAAASFERDIARNRVLVPYGYKADGTPRKRPAPTPEAQARAAAARRRNREAEVS